jgi:hypothetical protein
LAGANWGDPDCAVSWPHLQGWQSSLSMRSSAPQPSPRFLQRRLHMCGLRWAFNGVRGETFCFVYTSSCLKTPASSLYPTNTSFPQPQLMSARSCALSCLFVRAPGYLDCSGVTARKSTVRKTPQRRRWVLLSIWVRADATEPPILK